MEYNLTADREFFISSIGGIGDVSDLLITQYTFNHNIKLADYGSGVRRISFFALTYDKDDPAFHKASWSYDPHKKEIKGTLPLDFHKASTFVDQAAQRLIAEVLFELFDKVKDQIEDFDFEGLKKAMLQAIVDNPSYAEKTGFRVYSDYDIPTGDLPEIAAYINPARYGNFVKKLFVTLSFFKKTKYVVDDPQHFDKNKQGLYLGCSICAPFSTSVFQLFCHASDEAVSITTHMLFFPFGHILGAHATKRFCNQVRC